MVPTTMTSTHTVLHSTADRSFTAAQADTFALRYMCPILA